MAAYDPKDDAARQAAHRARIKDAGIKRVEVKVPAHRADEIRAIAAKMREDG